MSFSEAMANHQRGHATDSMSPACRRRAPASLLIVLLLTACAAPASSSPGSTAFQSITPRSAAPSPSVSLSWPTGSDGPECSSPDSLKCLTDAVAASSRQGRFSGVLLVAEDGEPVWHEAYGGRVTLETPLPVGSVTKMFTGVAVAQLVEAGKLSYDDIVGSYVPDLPADVAQATIGQLASHTAGVGFISVGSGLAYEPGVFHYSNAGFDLLALVVEEVVDQKFADHVEQRIFERAGMQATSFSASSPRGSPSGAGNSLSTAGDLLRFSNALFAYELLDEETTTLVTTPKVTFELGAYGYGFAVWGLNDEIPTVGHVGALSPTNVVAAVEGNPTLGRTIIIVCEYGFEDIEPQLIAYQNAINMGYFRG
jgi:CubicO group peptidase (beta-lactamase class C family)